MIQPMARKSYTDQFRRSPDGLKDKCNGLVTTEDAELFVERRPTRATEGTSLRFEVRASRMASAAGVRGSSARWSWPAIRTLTGLIF